MIILERLQVTRFKGVRAVALDLPERGAFLIEGSNEAGKSTLFEAIHFAMYGRTLAGTLAEAIPHDATDAEVSVRLRIARPGGAPDVLDITRTIASGTMQAVAGVRLRVERGGNEVEEVKRIGDANRRIAQELGGLNVDTFVNSCFVAQKQLAGLETLDRGQREAAVASLLNLDRLTRAAQSFATRPADADVLRGHEARVALAEATETLASTELRRLDAAANMRRLEVLEALGAVTDAAVRARAATGAMADAAARRERAARVIDANARATVAADAWTAVARAARDAVDASEAADRSRMRHADATAARTALPMAEAHLERLQAVESLVSSVTHWLVEGRPALRQEVSAIESRRLARQRALTALQEAEEQLRTLDSEAHAISARRDQLLPRIAGREASRARRVAFDALREAVAAREALMRAAAEADLAVAVRLEAEDQLATAREADAEASARLAVLDRDRDAVAHRSRLEAVRAALATAVAARGAHLQARTRNERLRLLTLGVLDASPDAQGTLALRLLIDHPVTGARVIDLAIGVDGSVSSANRAATDDEGRRTHHGEVPSLAPADLEALDREATRARDALHPLGEAPPGTTRVARERLAELDAILATPGPAFDQAAHAAATTDREHAAAEFRMRHAAVGAMGNRKTLARLAAQATASALEAVASVARQASTLGVDLPDDVTVALTVIDAGRRHVDEEMEATAEAAGALEAANREFAALADRRTPLAARAARARQDLEADDEDALDRAEADVRAAGRAGDVEATATWQAAISAAAKTLPPSPYPPPEAHAVLPTGQGQGASAWIANASLGVGFGVEVAASLPAREAVATFAETVRREATAARDDVARLRARAGEVHSAVVEAAADAERMRRALERVEGLLHAAHEAATEVEDVARGADVQGFAEATLQASNAASRYARSLAIERLGDLPTGLDGAGTNDHPGFSSMQSARRQDPPPEAQATATGAGRTASALGDWTSPQLVAEGFARAARVADAVEARRVVDEQDHAERVADRARAAAQADAETAWRAAAEAATGLGMRIGDRPDDPTEVIDEVRRSVTTAHGFEPDRATATQAWASVLADVGAATEAIAAARRTIGAEEAPFPLAEARARRDAARLELRARERAATILTTTRARMMAAILPDTQREMARLLPDLTAGRYRFPRLDDRFHLEVYDERKKGWIRRSLFSGGTQDQFSLALRLGFAIAALPRELGTAPGFLFLDEPLSSFDRERTRALVDLLRDPVGIVGSHFRQVFLISHSQAFDPGLFTYQIQMDGGRVAWTTLPGQRHPPTGAQATADPPT